MDWTKLFMHATALAEDAAGAAGDAAGTAAEGSSAIAMISSLLPMVLIIVVFYFLLIRPQRKKDKKVKDMLAALKVNDRVTTIGGIIGKVVSIKGETFVLETTKDKTKIRFLKAAVRSVDVKAEDLAAAVIEKKAEATDAKADDKADAKAKKNDVPEEKKAEAEAPAEEKSEETK